AVIHSYILRVGIMDTSATYSRDPAFRDFCDEYVRPHIDALEKRRLMYLNSFRWLFLASFIAVLALPLYDFQLVMLIDTALRYVHEWLLAAGLQHDGVYKSQAMTISWFIYPNVPLLLALITSIPVWR